MLASIDSFDVSDQVRHDPAGEPRSEVLMAVGWVSFHQLKANDVAALGNRQ